MRIFFASLLIVASSAQTDVTRIGPAVGAAVPAFSLTDHNGRTQTLSTLAGQQGTMLVFFRSADW